MIIILKALGILIFIVLFVLIYKKEQLHFLLLQRLFPSKVSDKKLTFFSMKFYLFTFNGRDIIGFMFPVLFEKRGLFNKECYDIYDRILRINKLIFFLLGIFVTLVFVI